MDAWNPGQYERFKTERAQPFWDLVRLVEFTDAARLLDVGCGTGELTRELRDRESLPYVLGIDSSAKMLAKAPSSPGLEFRHIAAGDFQPSEKFDIVFSNAALQWAEGHRQLFPKILGWLRPGGQLAVQMPTNFDHVSHTLADEVALRFGLRLRLTPVLSMEDYARLFSDCGVTQLNIFTKIYLHPMPDPLGIVEWVKGTHLTHFEKQMDPSRYQEYLREYAGELADRLGEGPCLYTYKRLFLAARI